MLKSILFSLVAMVLLSSPALAVLPDCPLDFKLQMQDFSIVSDNLVTLVGAGGSASNMNLATIYQTQQDQKICSWANQQEVVTFIQDGCIGASCGGGWAIGQGALVGGAQLQLIGDGCNPKLENQGLMVGLGQLVTKVDGTGAANAIHSLGVVQQQAAGNSAGTMSEVNAVAAGQFSSISGGPSTTGTVIADLGVMTSQTQIDM
jgi:hypothetical protein